MEQMKHEWMMIVEIKEDFGEDSKNFGNVRIVK